jgi:hypothetical protein
MASDSGFPLYEILTRESPVFHDKDFAVYKAAYIPSIDVTELAHFALGVFWKTAAHRWRTEIGPYRIHLGRYGEGIRQFILGTGQFPEGIALAIDVIPPSALNRSAVAPYESRDRSLGCHIFLFTIPGICFKLLVGNKMDKSIKPLWFLPNPDHVICINPDPEYILRRSFAKAFSTATISSKVRERLVL